MDMVGSGWLTLKVVWKNRDGLTGSPVSNLPTCRCKQSLWYVASVCIIIIIYIYMLLYYVYIYIMIYYITHLYIYILKHAYIYIKYYVSYIYIIHIIFYIIYIYYTLERLQFGDPWTLLFWKDEAHASAWLRSIKQMMRRDLSWCARGDPNDEFIWLWTTGARVLTHSH